MCSLILDLQSILFSVSYFALSYKSHVLVQMISVRENGINLLNNCNLYLVQSQLKPLNVHIVMKKNIGNIIDIVGYEIL